MDTREFLQAVWPAEGIYCLATPNPHGDGYVQNTFSSIDAVLKAIDYMKRTNLFFCVHTLKDAQGVFNPNKANKRTGELGAYEKRSHANMLEGKCFFFDLDVGEGKGYQTRQEALDGLEQFLFQTQLPRPLVTSSGGGYHVYWLLSTPLASLEWRRHAGTLRALASGLGLNFDPARTTDQSSVLRVVGTNNVKPGHPPRPCEALIEGTVTPTADFLLQLADLAGRYGTGLGSAVPAVVAGGPGRGNLAEPWTTTTTLLELTHVCEHVRDYKELSETGQHVDEPMWYAMLGLTQYADDGDWVAILGKANRTEAQKRAKLEQWNSATQGMPPSCAKLDSDCGGDACKRCPFKDKGRNPILIANELRKASAPAPAAPIALTPSGPTYTAICDPPFPFKRTKAGVVRLETYEDDNGNEFTEEKVILEYDLFPIELVEKTNTEHAFSLWVVQTPHAKPRILRIDSASLQDARPFHLMLFDNQVYVNGKEIQIVRDMWIAWLAKVQKEKAANRQFDHLGWADEARTEFIMPTQIYKIDGTSQPTVVSSMVQEVADTIYTRGTRAAQLKALAFYAEDKYFKHQFAVLAAYASPAFHCSGHAGMVINLGGETSGGKSSSLFTGAGLWGNPRQFSINGTRKGQTMLRQQTTAFTLSALPMMVDEITTHEDTEVTDWVLSATQNIERQRLYPNGKPMPTRKTWKASFHICTSNKSFHDMLANSSHASTAAEMRVFELWFKSFGQEGKSAAQRHMAMVDANYGWLGPEALALYMQHREAVDASILKLEEWITATFGLSAPERYWGWAIAVVIGYAKFLQRFGLCPYDLDKLFKWLLDEHLPAMRGVIQTNEVTAAPQSLLGSYLNDNQAYILRTSGDRYQEHSFPQNDPKGKLVAEYDLDARRLYVRKDAFKGYLKTRGAPIGHTFGALKRDVVVIADDVKKTIGAGTPYSMGRTICFVVDMHHPEFTDAVDATPLVGNIVQLRSRS